MESGSRSGTGLSLGFYQRTEERESEHRGEELMALPMCEQCTLSSSLGKQAGLGKKPSLTPTLTYILQLGKGQPHFSCVYLLPLERKKETKPLSYTT